MKKFLSIMLIISILSMSFTAYADTDEYIPEWLDFTVGSLQKIVGYDGSDVAYNSYLQGTAQAAGYGAMVQALNSIDGQDYGNLPKIPMNAVFYGMLDPTAGYLDGRYHAMVVNRDYVEQLYSFAGGYGENNRFKTLDDYYITFDGNYVINDGISYVGNNFLSQSRFALEGYIDFSNVGSAPIIFNSSNMPPLLFTGSTSHAFHHGVQLQNNKIYWLIDDTHLIAPKNELYVTTRAYVGCSLNRYGSGITDLKMIFNSGNTVTQNQNGYEITGNSIVGVDAVRIYDGVPETYSNVNSLTIIDEFEKCAGIQATIDEQEIEPPADIPYDNNDLVIILNPENNTDIKYVSTTNYNNYITDNSVSYTDYVYNNDNSVTNNVINNYNIYISGGGGGEFDDTGIIAKLQEILNAIVKFDDKFKFMEHQQFKNVFSNQPIYDNYADCILDHIEIDQYTDITESITPDTDNDGTSEMNSWLPQNDTDSDFPIHFQSVPFDVSWYNPYRQRVRTLMTIPIYILCVGYIITIYKRVFGVGGEQ